MDLQDNSYGTSRGSDLSNMRNALTLRRQDVRSPAMVLDVAALPEGTTIREFTESSDDMHLRKDAYEFNEEIHVDLSLYRAQDEVVVEGRIKTAATATCVRCLEGFAHPVEQTFRVVVRLVPDAEAKDDPGDEDFFLVPNNEPAWDTSGLVSDLITLSIPDNPLCTEDCSGLCPGCGKNLNRESCVCEDRQEDGPLGRLRTLMNGDERPKSD